MTPVTKIITHSNDLCVTTHTFTSIPDEYIPNVFLPDSWPSQTPSRQVTQKVLHTSLCQYLPADTLEGKHLSEGNLY